MEQPYDSKADTLLHIKRVNELLIIASAELLRRAAIHDSSKLESPEKELFDVMTPKLKALVYGSAEYKQSLDELGVALRHHYANNSHHPEYYDRWHCPMCNQDRKESETWVSNGTTPPTRFCVPCTGGAAIYECSFMPEDFKPGINGMDLFDLIEMFLDWKAAGERHNGDIFKSIEINKDRFKMSDQLAQIFRNTAMKLGYDKDWPA